MSRGIIFDIKEFSVFDGPGIRTTVFFKGCPMRCTWCHNPEGIRSEKELMVSNSGCAHCGACEKVCPTPGKCSSCGACVRVCPLGLRRIAGIEYEAKDLTRKILKDADYLKRNGGGYTISGGEPALQKDFLLELLSLLRGNHRAVETSGFCSNDFFVEMIEETELVLMDLKLVDAKEHRSWTSKDNSVILQNLDYLKRSEKSFILRIPVIPGVNDNIYKDAAEILKESKNLIRVELLPYHKTAGAKYSMLGLEYNPGFDAGSKPNMDTQAFTERDIPCMVL